MSVEMGSDGDRSVNARETTDSETVAAVDEFDGRPHLVIADIGRDDAWLAIEESAAVAVDERE